MALVVVTERDQIKATIRRIETQLADGAEKVFRTVGWPSGSMRNAPLYWRSSEHLWAFIGKDILPNRYWCLFGTDVGEPNQSLNISVEINPPVEGVNRHVRGQVVRAEHDDNVYLAHRGGLGGGRGGDIKIVDFWRLFRNPRLEPIIWREDGRAATFHLIGPIGTSQFIRDLQHFVSEAERLRALVREGKLPS